MYLTESWIVEDTDKDKTALYGLKAPVGAWAVAMRVENDEVWNNVKEGNYLGFSIEGFFTDKEEFSAEDMETLAKIEELINLYNN